MTFYIDTSFIVAALTREEFTASAQEWLVRHGGETFLVSDWVTTEVSAALSMKVRVGAIDEAHRVVAIASYRKWLDESLTNLPVATALFLSATRLADKSGLGLRAGDALHLAVAAEQDAAMVTYDNALAKAARTLGLRAIMPLPK